MSEANVFCSQSPPVPADRRLLSSLKALIAMLRKSLAACSCKTMEGKIMALFIILPFIILQKAKYAPVKPSVRKVPINASLKPFWIFDLGISNLFRISCFGFRILTMPRAGVVSLTILLVLAFLPAGCSRDETYKVPGLMKMLQDSDPGARCTAVQVLGSYGAEAKPAVPQLAVALQDSDENVRVGAAYALAAIGPDAEPALPSLLEALKAAKKSDTELRVAIVYAIPAVGPRAPAAQPALQAAFQDADPRVREEAWRGLRKLNVVVRYPPPSAPPGKK